MDTSLKNYHETMTTRVAAGGRYKGAYGYIIEKKVTKL
jgi:hypothetical protein